MQIAKYIARRTGRTVAEVFMGANPLCELSQDANGVVSIDRWDAELGKKPSAQEIVNAAAAPDPVDVPEAVTMRQGRLAMLHAGVLDDVEAAVAAMPGNDGAAARIEWEYATSLRRSHPLIQALGAALGMDDKAIDTLFVAAGAIPE